jgi:prenyltransferase beta subunit
MCQNLSCESGVCKNKKEQHGNMQFAPLAQLNNLVELENTLRSEIQKNILL